MSEQEPHHNIEFEPIDADAVCEKCGTVNPEESLLCKVCGNNLRDQRRNRISQGKGAETFGRGVSRFRVFTGVLSALGIITLLLTVYSLPNIEAWLVKIQAPDAGDAVAGLWSGQDALLYDALLEELEQNPISREEIDASIENPVDDDSYNGRYVLVRKRGGPRPGVQVVGDANLSRRGDRIHFVVKLRRRGIDIRGYATLEGPEGEAKRPVVWDSAGVRIRGTEYLAQGYADKQPAGGHLCFAQSQFDDNTYSVAAYRLR